MKKSIWLIIAGLLFISLLAASCSSTPTKIRVATDATWPPFESVNEQTKQVEGFDIDIMNAIAEKEKLDIEYVNVAFDPLLAGMAQGMYDAAISSITITEDRAERYAFLRPLFCSRSDCHGTQR